LNKFLFADYLKPTNEKQEKFSVRNRMTEIADDFSNTNEENTFIYGEKKNMYHIYNCEILNEEKKPNMFNAGTKTKNIIV
jgi:hypothetical protein